MAIFPDAALLDYDHLDIAEDHPIDLGIANCIMMTAIDDPTVIKTPNGYDYVTLMNAMIEETYRLEQRQGLVFDCADRLQFWIYICSYCKVDYRHSSAVVHREEQNENISEDEF